MLVLKECLVDEIGSIDVMPKEPDVILLVNWRLMLLANCHKATL